MDISLLAILWVVILIVQAVNDKKKKKLPPPAPPAENTEGRNFDIPTLANDPNFPGEDVTVYRDAERPAEVREVNFTEMYRQRKSTAREKVSARTAESNVESNVQTTANESKSLPLNLNAESAMNAMILSEIFGKPKALRR
ncbi:MAG: hypothetical protein IJU91_03385 [Selenomonadaceae bacterium]|nr:hypothetical protein [Selenomonadaceae bacterium]